MGNVVRKLGGNPIAKEMAEDSYNSYNLLKMIHEIMNKR